MTFANYAEYIDVAGNDPKVHPSLEQFTAATGIHVNYDEVIQDDATTFATIVPELEAGVTTGWDLMVVGSDDYLARLRELGYLVPLQRAPAAALLPLRRSGVQEPQLRPRTTSSPCRGRPA